MSTTGSDTAGCAPASMAPFALSGHPPIRFGVDRVERLADDVAKTVGAEASLLLAADPGLTALTDRVAGILAKGGHRVTVFNDIRSDPLGSQVDAGADAARNAGAKAVVCLGGGSTLDAGKLIAAIAGADQPAEFYGLAANRFPKAQLKKICIPTTAGTGSEATTNRNANPMNDAVCLQAIRLISRHLPRAVAQPDDLEARGHVQIAACLAGIGIDNAGTAVAHAIGHALGAIGHVHHGRAVALALRAAIGWNAEASPERHAMVAAAMGIPCEGRETPAVAGELAPAFDAFLRHIGLNISLAGDGLDAADSDRLAATIMAPENAVMRDANIRAVSAADARRFAHAILTAA